MNSKEQIDFARDMVNEATAAHWSNSNLLKRLNAAQRRIALRVAQSPGQWLVKSASVTPVASVITLPSDCSKPIYLEETSSGEPIGWIGSVTHRRVSRGVGVDLGYGALEGYPLQATLEVNQTSYVTACTLWYQRRVPDLHAGDASAAGASSLTLAADVNRVYEADYYNGLVIEAYNAAWATATAVSLRSVISDYTAAGVCTVVGTPTNAYAYGMISCLPEETHQLMCYMVASDALLKPGATIDQNAVEFVRQEMHVLRKEVYDWLASRSPGQDRVETSEEY